MAIPSFEIDSVFAHQTSVLILQFEYEVEYRTTKGRETMIKCPGWLPGKFYFLENKLFFQKNCFIIEDILLFFGGENMTIFFSSQFFENLE
jgi:hypothetical protein